MSRTLEGVKVGDKIKVRHQYGKAFDCHEVENVTKTRAVCKGGAAFMIDSGVMVGSGFSGRFKRYGSFATDADFARAALGQRFRDAQDSIRRMTVSESNLEAAEAFIAASQPKPEGVPK